jgi:hypothetical protein
MANLDNNLIMGVQPVSLDNNGGSPAPAPAPACNPIVLSAISTIQQFNAWYQAHTNVLDGMAQTTSTPSTEQTRELSRIELDVINMNNCLQNKLNTNGSSANNISIAHEDILNLQDEITREEADVAIARDRVAYIRSPQNSNYEGWFPIDRPITTLSLIILIGITTFLFVFIVLILLSLMGINIVIFSEMKAYPSYVSYFPKSFWIVLVVLIGMIIAYVKK